MPDSHCPVNNMDDFYFREALLAYTNHESVKSEAEMIADKCNTERLLEVCAFDLWCTLVVQNSESRYYDYLVKHKTVFVIIAKFDMHLSRGYISYYIFKKCG
jgi:hypothetical protein